MRDQDGTDKREVSGSERRARKAYAKPAVREYGSIAKLTQSGGDTTTEPGAGMMPFPMMCL